MGNNIIMQNIEGTHFFISENIRKLNSSSHFFSTRVGGRSEGAYKSLNLGVYTKDDTKDVGYNFERIFECCSMGGNKTVYLNQVHSDRFHVVDNDNYKEILNSEGDALITATPGITIGVFTADCVPILVQDVENKIVSAIHAGWKGTFLNIAGKVLAYIIECMGSKPENIYAAIGPSIGPCCFEVKEEVAEKFTYKSFRNDKWFVNLWKENYEHIKECGIPMENIDAGSLCTKCNEELFFSYRRDNGVTGRMGSFIALK